MNLREGYKNYFRNREKGENMKTLLEIQTELREIGKRMQELAEEVEELKESKSGNKTEEYKQIELKAKNHKIENKQLAAMPQMAKELYLTLLTAAAQLGGAYEKERLSFIWRIAGGCGYSGSLEALIQKSMKIDSSFLDDVREQLGTVKESFVLDALLVLNLSGKAAAEEMAFLAETADILGCTSEDLRVLSLLVKALIEGDEQGFQDIFPEGEYTGKWSGQFWHHISEEWIRNARHQVYDGYGEVLYANGALVKVGSVLKIIKGEFSDSEEKITIPRSGILVYTENLRSVWYAPYLPRYKGSRVMVLSCFDSYEAWKKENENISR